MLGECRRSSLRPAEVIIIVTNSEPRLTTGQEEVIKETLWKFRECFAASYG
jgi:hypothetical protein